MRRINLWKSSQALQEQENIKRRNERVMWERTYITNIKYKRESIKQENINTVNVLFRGVNHTCLGKLSCDCDNSILPKGTTFWILISFIRHLSFHVAGFFFSFLFFFKAHIVHHKFLRLSSQYSSHCLNTIGGRNTTYFELNTDILKQIKKREIFLS